ncbi:MAG: DUF1080 domain-containing protein [Gemmatimonadaceae bacterium]
MRASLAIVALLVVAPHVASAQAKQMKPEDTEVWSPEPKVIIPGKTSADAPSDAIVLFGGKSLDEWVTSGKTDPAGWTVSKGVMTVNKKSGDIQTKRSFRNYQLHLEWRIPPDISGSGQARGNSGVFLALAPDGGYELQILDSYTNKTYVNGQAGSIYKQSPPLVNAMRKPGEWQVYDVIWTAPTADAPPKVTAFHNGVLVQNGFQLKGTTEYIGLPRTLVYDRAPIMLQAHGDPSAPISFRNIWVREL